MIAGVCNDKNENTKGNMARKNTQAKVNDGIGLQSGESCLSSEENASANEGMFLLFCHCMTLVSLFSYYVTFFFYYR